MAHRIDVRGGAAGRAAEPAAQEKPRQLWIPAAVNLTGVKNMGSVQIVTTVVLMTGITAAIPYGFSALARLKWRWIDHKTMQNTRFTRQTGNRAAIGSLDDINAIVAGEAGTNVVTSLAAGLSGAAAIGGQG